MSGAISNTVTGFTINRGTWGSWVQVSSKNGPSDRVVLMRQRLVTISGTIVTTTTPCTVVSGITGPFPGPVEIWAELFGSVHLNGAPVVARTPFNGTYPEFQFSYLLFDPPDELPMWSIDPMPPIVRGAQLRCETNWIKRIKGIKKSSVTFDGNPYKHNQVIQTSKLAAGPHLFSIETKKSRKPARNFQLDFSVIEPVFVAFEKPKRFDLDRHIDRLASGRSRSVHRQQITLTIKNQADYDLPMFPVLTSIPPGWMAWIEGEPYAKVKAGRRKKWKVKLEFIFPWNISKENQIQISVAAGAGGLPGHSGVQAGYASVDVPIKLSASNRKGLSKIEKASQKNYRSLTKPRK